MFCGNCGAKLPEGTKYCEYCGYEMKTAKEGFFRKTGPQYGIVHFQRFPSRVATYSNAVVRIDRKQVAELRENQEVRIDIIDGKAKLMRENFCDGFGDCLPNCPTGAISFEEREAPEYDEKAVKAAKEKKTMKTGADHFPGL